MRSPSEMKTAEGGVKKRNKKAILIYQSCVSVRLNEQLFDFLLWRRKTAPHVIADDASELMKQARESSLLASVCRAWGTICSAAN